MPKAVIGKAVPVFSLESTGDRKITRKDLQDRITVLYFYPKDNTPGCTMEGHDFRDNFAKFTRLGAQIFGVSRDSLKSHENFKNKHKFPFDLIADPDEILCAIFDVIKMKNMYGKQVRGIERSTFLIDGKGVLRREWRKIKVDGHVAKVLAAVKELN
jgi:peroxiredoxin Q/BCP